MLIGSSPFAGGRRALCPAKGDGADPAPQPGVDAGARDGGGDGKHLSGDERSAGRGRAAGGHHPGAAPPHRQRARQAQAPLAKGGRVIRAYTRDESQPRA
eukprot:8285988-Pyramimonas_sp.AAC.1